MRDQFHKSRKENKNKNKNKKKKRIAKKKIKIKKIKHIPNTSNYIQREEEA